MRRSKRKTLTRSLAERIAARPHQRGPAFVDLVMAMYGNLHLLTDESVRPKLDQFLYIRWWMARFCQPIDEPRTPENEMIEGDACQLFAEATVNAPHIAPGSVEFPLASWSIWGTTHATVLTPRGLDFLEAIGERRIWSELTVHRGYGGWRIQHSGLPDTYWRRAFGRKASFAVHDDRLHLPTRLQRLLGVEMNRTPLTFIPPQDEQGPTYL